MAGIVQSGLPLPQRVTPLTTRSRPTTWVQPLRTADLEVVRRPKLEAEPKVAVLLNANARKVTEKIVRSLSHVVPEEDLFLSRSELDARRIAQTVVDRRYHTVFC